MSEQELADGTLVGGRFRISKLIGVGGFSTVYRAFDEKEQMEVAVKVLRRELARHEMWRRRFLSEARRTAELSRHASATPEIDPVIAVHHVAEEGEEQAYFVMELLEGASLHDLLVVEERLEWDEAREILLQTAAGLWVAHERQLVHRDVTPANVWVVSRGPTRVKVIDFGISKRLGPTRVETAGELFGTPGYIAPEQLTGAAVTPRTDVYALGLLACDMLIGTVHRDCSREWTLEELNRRAPDGVGELLMSAREQDPSLRPESARDFYQRLASLPERRGPPALSRSVPTERLGPTHTAQLASLGPAEVSAAMEEPQHPREEAPFTIVEQAPPRFGKLFVVVGATMAIALGLAIAAFIATRTPARPFAVAGHRWQRVLDHGGGFPVANQIRLHRSGKSVHRVDRDETEPSVATVPAVVEAPITPSVPPGALTDRPAGKQDAEPPTNETTNPGGSVVLGHAQSALHERDFEKVVELLSSNVIDRFEETDQSSDQESFFKAACLRGEALRLLGEYRLALQAFERAVAIVDLGARRSDRRAYLYPRLAAIRRTLGWSHDALGERKSAIAEFKAAFEAATEAVASSSTVFSFDAGAWASAVPPPWIEVVRGTPSISFPQDGGETYAFLACVGGTVWLEAPARVDLERTPWVRWTWATSQFPLPSEGSPPEDAVGPELMLAFRKTGAPRFERILHYDWSAEAPTKQPWFHRDRVAGWTVNPHWSACTGPSTDGGWVTVVRNVAEDYGVAFPQQTAPLITGVIVRAGCVVPGDPTIVSFAGIEFLADSDLSDADRRARDEPCPPRPAAPVVDPQPNGEGGEPPTMPEEDGEGAGNAPAKLEPGA